MLSRLKPVVWVAAAIGLAGIVCLLLAQRGELDSLRREMAKLANNSETQQKAQALNNAVPVPALERQTPVDTLKSGGGSVVMAQPAVQPSSDLTGSSEPNQRDQTPEEQAFAEQQQNDRIASHLDGALDADVADPSGEGAIRQGFAALRDASAANSVRSVECRSRMCRAVVVSNDSAAQAKLGHQLRGHEPFNHGAFYHYDLESSPPTTTIYIAMHGAELGAPAP